MHMIIEFGIQIAYLDMLWCFNLTANGFGSGFE